MTLSPPHFTDDFVCMGSLTDRFFLHTLHFYHFGRGSSWFQNIWGSSLYFIENSQITAIKWCYILCCISVLNCDLRWMLDCHTFTPALWRLLVMLLTVGLYHCSHKFLSSTAVFSLAKLFDIWLLQYTSGFFLFQHILICFISSAQWLCCGSFLSPEWFAFSPIDNSMLFMAV